MSRLTARIGQMRRGVSRCRMRGETRLRQEPGLAWFGTLPRNPNGIPFQSEHADAPLKQMAPLNRNGIHRLAFPNGPPGKYPRVTNESTQTP